MNDTLGERIAYHRKRFKLTQEALAEQCSVTAQAVSKWENDLTAPDISLLPRLAEIFSITCDELLGVRRQITAAVDPEAVDFTKAILKVRIVSNGDPENKDPILQKKSKIDVNLPLSVADAVLNSGLVPVENLKGIDLKQIVPLVKVGVIGKIVEIEQEGGNLVEIWVE